MIGKRKIQRNLFDVGNVYDLSLSRHDFHYQLAKASDRLFTDESFASFYSKQIGRPSVPPSELALLVLLQGYANVSCEEAVARSGCDLRWAAVLRRPAGSPLCARSTLELFHAHLLVHEEARQILESSLAEAKRRGLLSRNVLRAATDTKPINGRGAVEDTYNLLAAGIRQLARVLARRDKLPVPEWLSSHGLSAYLAPSIKGTVSIDWSDQEAKDKFLASLVSDARRVLAMADGGDAAIKEAATLLCQILLQDVVETTSADGSLKATIKEGTSPGRVPSVTDPEQRHGRKSKSKRFNGHKAAIAADIPTGLITATKVLPGDAPDATGVIDLVEQSEENTGLPVEETLGDCAYGGGQTRQEFADAERPLYAKVPAEPQRNGLFPKSAFLIDLNVLSVNGSQVGTHPIAVTCPGGQTTGLHTNTPDGGKTFSFGKACTDCALRAQCTDSLTGRTLRVHPQEQLLQNARAYQNTPEGKAHLKERLIVENALGRLAKLGIGQAKRNGRAKTGCQLAIAAAVANLRRTWNWEDAQNNDCPVPNNNRKERKAERKAPKARIPGLRELIWNANLTNNTRFSTISTFRSTEMAFAA